MGIESDQLVFDYLSRVGDLAQQRQLPSATRMRLVSELRSEIERRRSDATADSPAVVRRILDRLGTPDEVVAAADRTGRGDVSRTEQQERPGAVPSERRSRPAVPRQRAGDAAAPPERPKGLRRMVPRPRREQDPPRPRTGASPPHLAGEDELGPSGSEPDWWRVDSTPFGVADTVPGFVGGVEIPEILRPPEAEKDHEEGEDEDGGAADVADPADGTTAGRRLSRLRVTGFGSPLLLLAAALLVGGVVLDKWFALALGWLIAYGSRRLSAAETKWAVLGMPGVVAAAAVGWLWGRSEGRWGEPIAQGHMAAAVTETWPWAVRGAAVASALFLVWRARRHRR
ncbi:HAAS signaling domain-containing protein [Streptomyces sp. NPDC002577]